MLGPPDNRGLLRQLFVVGNFALGPNVLNDGAILMSEDTMAEVFGAWWSDRPAFIGIKLVKGADPDVVRRISTRRSPAAAKSSPFAISRSANAPTGRARRRSATSPISVSSCGVMIGMVFIYYAQYQIIRFYLPEYAILKSLGYDWWFFLFMIGQIGAAIITPAFLVAFTLGRFVYGATEAAMHLGMTMGLREMVVALVACVIMTVVSSLFAIRRLVEGRSHHAVRVTMTTDTHGFGPPVVEAVDVHHHYGEGRSGSMCCSTSTCRSARASC